jgi:cytochrome c556
MTRLAIDAMRSNTLAALVLRLVLAAAVALPCCALAQDAALPPAKDTIFARKILMGAIDMNMDEIETMLAPEGKLDLGEGQEHAETISTMLMAFPHMFPASTNQWKAGVEHDPAMDTFASPAVWTNMADFYARATAASKTAFEASRAKRADAFRPLIVQLRLQCNACHAIYMKTE